MITRKTLKDPQTLIVSKVYKAPDGYTIIINQDHLLTSKDMIWDFSRNEWNNISGLVGFPCRNYPDYIFATQIEKIVKTPLCELLIGKRIQFKVHHKRLTFTGLVKDAMFDQDGLTTIIMLDHGGYKYAKTSSIQILTEE